MSNPAAELWPRRPPQLPPFVGRRRKLDAAPREMPVEVVGCSVDATFSAVVDTVREFRTVYASLLKVTTVTMSQRASFDAKYGAPQAGHGRVRLFVNNAPFELFPNTGEKLSSTPTATAARVRSFFQTEVLGFKALRWGTLSAEERQGILPNHDVTIQPFYVETMRRSCYLVASVGTGRAVLVDPLPFVIDDIAASLASRALQVTAIIFTHVPQDVRLPSLGAFVPQLFRADNIRVIAPGTGGDVVGLTGADVTTSGFPAEGITTVALDKALLGTPLAELHLRVTQPAESCSVRMSVLLRAQAAGESADTRVAAVFTGISMGLDCPGPAVPGTAVDVAAVRLQIGCKAAITSADDSTLILPSYGGYSNSTHALDLAWVTHVGDARRACGSLFKAIEADDCGVAMFAFLAGLLGVVQAPSWPRTEEHNVQIIAKALSAPDAPAPNHMPKLVTSADELKPILAGAVAAHICGTGTLVLDVRESLLGAHRKRKAVPRVAGALCIPMTEGKPVTSRGAKKAELWTSTLLNGAQPVLGVAENIGAAAAAQARLACVMDPALIIGWITADRCEELAVTADLSPYFFDGTALESYADFDATEPVVTVDACRQVNANGEATVVVDVRSPYEFRNGSHAASEHVPLTDCRGIVQHAMGCKDPNFVPAIPPIMVDNVVAHVHRMLDPSRVAHVVLYCAAGYRSFIAASILDAAARFQQEQQLQQEGAMQPTAPLRTVRLGDVARGALQLMMHHPNTWVVKDRNVICIS